MSGFYFFIESCTLVNNEHYGSKLDNAIHTTVIKLLSLEQLCMLGKNGTLQDRPQQLEEGGTDGLWGNLTSVHLSKGAELLGF